VYLFIYLFHSPKELFNDWEQTKQMLDEEHQKCEATLASLASSQEALKKAYDCMLFEWLFIIFNYFSIK